MKARPYRMRQRADDATATGDRILAAATARYADLPYEQLRLDDVATDAGVAVQTVLRRFGSKAALVVAVAERGLAEIVATREHQTGSDAAATLHELVRHYRRWGALILKVYAEAPRIDGMPAIAAAGRAYHVDWCRAHFTGLLPAGLDEAERHRRLAGIVAACDATTWRILVEDFRLDDGDVERVVAGLVFPLLTHPTEEGAGRPR